MKTLQAFHQWMACTIFYLPISHHAFIREATNAAEPWKMTDSYRTYQYVQGSHKFISKIFDPSTVPVNPTSSSSKILGVDPASKSKNKPLFKNPFSSKAKSITVEDPKGKGVASTPAARPGSLDAYIPPITGKRQEADFEKYFEDATYSHQIVAAVLSTGQFKQLDQFAKAQLALGQYTPDMIHTAFNSYLLPSASTTRLEYWAWLHLFAIAASGEGKTDHVLQIQLAVKQGLEELLAKFESNPANLALQDTLAPSLTEQDVKISTQALKTVIDNRWNTVDERLGQTEAGASQSLKKTIADNLKQHPTYFDPNSQKFIAKLFTPAAVEESVSEGRAATPNEFAIYLGQFYSADPRGSLKRGYFEYINPTREKPFTPEILQKAMQVNNFKVLHDFARAQFAMRGFTPDLIQTAFDNYLLTKSSIGRVEYVVWFQMFATVIFGKSSNSYRLQAEAALQGGLTSLLEKFRLHPESLQATDPLAVNLLAQHVIDSAEVLKSFVNDRWRDATQVPKKAIREIPFAQEIHIPHRGLGEHLGESSNFKQLVSFDDKLSALVAKSTDLTEDGDEIKLTQELLRMVNPETQNSIQVKTAAVVFLNQLATQEPEDSKLKALAQAIVNELIQFGRRDANNKRLKNPLILEHDQVLLKALRSSSSKQ